MDVVERSAAKREQLMTVTEDGPPSLPEIISRYLAGESMQVLAAECKKGRRILYSWILAECGGERYRELVTEALVARIADADEALEEARGMGDAVRVAACREACRFYRMDFERRRPALYGAKQEGGGGTTLIVMANLRPAPQMAGEVSDAEVITP
jgi:hypothetical protein